MAEFVYSLVTTPPITDLHGGAFREPDREFGLVEIDGGVSDVEMFPFQTNLRNRHYQIGLQAQNLVAVHCDPGMTLEPKRIDCMADPDLVKGPAWVRTLLEPKLPRRGALYIRQSFATKLKITNFLRVEDKGESCSPVSEIGGESTSILAVRYSSTQNAPEGAASISAT